MAQTQIRVERQGQDTPYEFKVEVNEGGSSSSHRVSMTESVYQELTGGKLSPEDCVEWAFEFLLEREPKESIMGRFDILVIERYFPEFRTELAKRVVKA